MIIIHGDRVEALAVAISGSFNNYLIAHLEGGEISGTIDEHIRHSVSKLYLEETARCYFSWTRQQYVD